MADRLAHYTMRRFFFFWPIVDSVDDIERITLLGFWINVATGVLGAISMGGPLLRASSLSGRAGALLLAVCALLFYYVGANGIRRNSFKASVLIFVISAAFVVIALRAHHLSPGTIVPLILSIIVMRGIWLTSHFVPAGTEVPPLKPLMLLNRSFTDRVPQEVWPRYQWIFYGLGALFLLVAIVGMLILSGAFDNLLTT
jgi:hypothetical protein